MSEDLFVRTDRQRLFVERAAALADQFAQRAPAHDQNGTFPFENYEDLRTSGYVRMTVPPEFGGEGATLTETLLAQERLARGDGATALSIGWHLAGIGKFAETRVWPAPLFEHLCGEVVAQGALFNSCASEVETGSPSRGGRPTTTARRSTDGWILGGRKAFATLAPVLGYALVTAAIEGESYNGWFLAPMTTPGVTVVETWNAMGMRATGSHDLVLTDVHLPADALAEPYGPGAPSSGRAAMPGGGAGWNLHIPAVYLGIARAARDFALEYARTRTTTALAGPIAELPHVQARLGQIDLDLFAARSAVYTAAKAWEEQPERRPALVPLLGAAKTIATHNALKIVDEAMRVVGIAGLSRALPLERYYRDVRAGLHNPPMDDATLTLLARTALRELQDA